MHVVEVFVTTFCESTRQIEYPTADQVNVLSQMLRVKPRNFSITIFRTAISSREEKCAAIQERIAISKRRRFEITKLLFLSFDGGHRHITTDISPPNGFCISRICVDIVNHHKTVACYRYASVSLESGFLPDVSESWAEYWKLNGE